MVRHFPKPAHSAAHRGVIEAKWMTMIFGRPALFIKPKPYQQKANELADWADHFCQAGRRMPEVKAGRSAVQASHRL